MDKNLYTDVLLHTVLTGVFFYGIFYEVKKYLRIETEYIKNMNLLTDTIKMEEKRIKMEEKRIEMEEKRIEMEEKRIEMEEKRIEMEEKRIELEEKIENYVCT